MPDLPGGRFLSLAEVADELATSIAQVTALVHRGDLRALKLGGRGQLRVQRSDLEMVIESAYAETVRHLDGMT